MSVEQHQTILHSIDSRNPDVTGVADQINEYTEMVKRGELSTSEYADLLRDTQRQIEINKHMIELENLEKLNTAINGLIKIASLA
jgi:polyhydroxyalkanoate synthesis regulator phasin